MHWVRTPSDDENAENSFSRSVGSSRSSTGVKEEHLVPSEGFQQKSNQMKDGRMLLMFFLMVFVGLGNKVLNDCNDRYTIHFKR